MDAIKENGSLSLEEKSMSFTKTAEITSLKLKRGFYLLQISGIFTNASVVGDFIELSIKQ